MTVGMRGGGYQCDGDDAGSVPLVGCPGTPDSRARLLIDVWFAWRHS